MATMVVLITWEFPDTLITVSIIVVVTIVGHLLLRRAITSLTRHMTKRARQRSENGAFGLATNQRLEQRTATIGSVLRNLVAIVVWVVAVMTIMSTIGVPLGPLLASAGIGGIAVAFGAQSLVKDVLSGLAILVEDQYGVGDWIDTGDVAGTVEEVTLRVTQVRDTTGTLWFVPNGQIAFVGNSSQGWAAVMIDIPIAAGQDITSALDVLRTVAERFGTDDEWTSILHGPPSVLGVQDVSAGTVTLRMSMKTTADKQWAPSRALRQQAVDALAGAGFELPQLSTGDASS